MAEKEKALYSAGFVYSDAILRDFEALYLEKKKLSPTARIILGLVGFAGVIYFAIMLYREGWRIAYVGYLMVCSLLLVLAFSRKNRPDDTVAKYRKYYLGHRVSFSFDESGVEMKLEGQKSFARSKYKEIYGLNDTDRCLYLTIKGRAYYIVPREAVSGGEAEELMKFLQKKCGKKFIHYELADLKGEST